MKYIGIDPSLTATGVVILGEDIRDFTYELIQTSNKIQPFSRVDKIADDVERFVTEYATTETVAVYETFMGGYSKEAYMRGALDYAILYGRLPVYTVLRPTPTQVKKFISGKGNVGKDVIAVEVHKRWDVTWEDFSDIKPNLVNNLIDAYVMAHMARCVHKDGVGYPKRMFEVVKGGM
jgi:crossover junction endodeoxyribonuclease RuvC